MSPFHCRQRKTQWSVKERNRDTAQVKWAFICSLLHLVFLCLYLQVSNFLPEVLWWLLSGIIKSDLWVGKACVCHAQFSVYSLHLRKECLEDCFLYKKFSTLGSLRGLWRSIGDGWWNTWVGRCGFLGIRVRMELWPRRLLPHLPLEGWSKV
jgi:hypothetical protein